MAISKILRARLLTLAVMVACVVMVLSGCATSTAATGGAIKTDKGVTGKTINLGILTPLTGPVADPIGKPLTSGIEVFFKGINDAGGIDGYKINLIEKDTQYSPQLQVQAYNEIHDQVLMIAESLGTPTTFAIKDLAGADQMLVSAATLSSALAREKYLILIGTPYRLQVENAFDYIVNKLGIAAPKTGIIYQDDEYGQDGLTGYKESITAYHLNDVAQVSFAATAKDYSAQVLQLKRAGAKYVFMTTTPTATATIIGTAHALGYDPQWILQSPAYSPLLLATPVAPLLQHEAWLVTQGAAWGDTSKPGMADLIRDQTKYAPAQKPDGFFEFGYTEAKLTYTILKKAIDNKDLTRAGMVKAFESLKTVDLGGLLPTVTYGGTGATGNDRVPSRDNTIYAIDATQPLTIKDLSGDFTGTAAAASQF